MFQEGEAWEIVLLGYGVLSIIVAVMAMRKTEDKKELTFWNQIRRGL